MKPLEVEILGMVMQPGNHGLSINDIQCRIDPYDFRRHKIGGAIAALEAAGAIESRKVQTSTAGVMQDRWFLVEGVTVEVRKP